MDDRLEILISGYGGQGVVRFGQVLGSAAVLQGLRPTMLISHGTETRGGYVRSQVVISKEFVGNPSVERPDFLCALSDVAYRRFLPLVSHGVVLYDPDIVSPDPDSKLWHLAVPGRRLAHEKLGDALFANSVFLGVLGRLLSGRLDTKSFLDAIETRFTRLQEQNKKAFLLGLELPVTGTGDA